MDQALLPMDTVTAQETQQQHLPKLSVIAWNFDGVMHDQRAQSVFYQKKVNPEALRPKPGEFSIWFNPWVEASFAVDQISISIS